MIITKICFYGSGKFCLDKMKKMKVVATKIQPDGSD